MEVDVSLRVSFGHSLCPTTRKDNCFLSFMGVIGTASGADLVG